MRIISSAQSWISFFLLILSASVTLTTADILSVNPDGSGDFTSIQEAVDAADDGDWVLVGAGIHTEPGGQVVDRVGKDIILRATGIAQETILDGEGMRRGIYCGNGETRSTLIQGFTIRNCLAT